MIDFFAVRLALLARARFAVFLAAFLCFFAGVVLGGDAWADLAGHRDKGARPVNGKWLEGAGLSLRESIKGGDIAFARQSLKAMAADRSPAMSREARECQLLIELESSHATRGHGSKVSELARAVLREHQGTAEGVSPMFLDFRLHLARGDNAHPKVIQ